MRLNDIQGIRLAESQGRYREVDASLLAMAGIYENMAKGMLKNQNMMNSIQSRVLNVIMGTPMLKSLVTDWIVNAILGALGPETAGISWAIALFLQTPQGNELINDTMQFIANTSSRQLEESSQKLERLQSGEQKIEGFQNLVKFWLESRLSGMNILKDEFQKSILDKYMPDIQAFIQEKATTTIQEKMPQLRPVPA